MVIEGTATDCALLDFDIGIISVIASGRVCVMFPDYACCPAGSTVFGEEDVGDVVKDETAAKREDDEKAGR